MPSSAVDSSLQPAVTGCDRRWLLLGLAALALLFAPLAAQNQVDEAEAAGDTPAAATPTTAPTTPAATPVAAPARMAIPDAVEGLADLDEPTRQQSIERIRTANEADIPALEKFADSSDPEVRRQVGLVLKKLKRGELAFTLAFPDGQPLADAQVTLRIYNADEVRVINSGFGQPVRVMYNPPRQGFAKEELQVDATTGADGRVSAGRMNDGKYLVLIDSPEGLPRQVEQKTVTLRENTQPGQLTFKRGVSLTITVVGEDNHPIPDATVANIEQSNMVNQLQNHPVAQIQGYLRMMTSATTDEKGVAVLDQIGLSAIQPMAFAQGYETKVMDKMAVADGGSDKLTIQLVKIKPVKFSIQLRNQQTNKDLADARVLIVSSAKVAQVFGAMWYSQVAVENLDDYLHAGAVDLNQCNDKGKIEFSIEPDMYTIFAFSGNQVLFMQMALNSNNTSQTLRMRPILQR